MTLLIVFPIVLFKYWESAELLKRHDPDHQQQIFIGKVTAWTVAFCLQCVNCMTQLCVCLIQSLLYIVSFVMEFFLLNDSPPFFF